MAGLTYICRGIIKQLQDKLFQKRLYHKVMLMLKNTLPKRPLAHAWASSWSCRPLSWAPLTSWQLVVGPWVGREKARNSAATGLTPAVALRLGLGFAFKVARLFLTSLWKFQEMPVIVLSSREVLIQYVSCCLHRLLVCLSLVHDEAKVCQNCWLTAHEIEGVIEEQSF